MELNILLLCFAAALCTFALLSKANPDWNPLVLVEKKRVRLGIIAFLAFIAVLVRVWKFGAVPSGMNQDGSMAAVDALALASHGTDRFGTRLPVYFEAWGYGQMSVLLSYCMVPLIKLFGLSAVTARLPMLIVSLAGIYVLYRFTERVFGSAPALAVLLVAAINPWHIMQSRWALDCNLFPHFILFSLYFLHRGLEKRGWLYLSMVFFGLTMYTYGIAFYSIPILLVALCAYLLAKRLILPRQALVAALVYFIVAWPIFAVVAINQFHLKTLDTGIITMQYFPDSIRKNDLLIYSQDFLNQLLSNLRSLSDISILEKGDFSWNYVQGYGQMYMFALPFIVLGLWLLCRNAGEGSKPEPQAQAGRFFWLAWLAVAVFSGLMVNGVNTNRINIIFYPLIALMALGVWHVVFEAGRMKRVAIAMAALLLFSFAGFSSTYFGPHSKLMAKDFCSGLPEAIAYADRQDADVLYITADSRSEDAYSCSEIYTLFGASVDARYFQGKAEAVNKATGKPLLPYRVRYQYVDFDTFTLDQPVGSVYVVNEEETGLFDSAEYDITMFGGFGVAVKTTEVAYEPTPEDAPPDESEPDGEPAVG